jgi:hypothetical protein
MHRDPVRGRDLGGQRGGGQVPLLADPPASLGRRGKSMWRRVRDAFPTAPVVQESVACTWCSVMPKAGPCKVL